MAAKRGVELSAEMVSQLTILHVCGISPRVYLELLRADGCPLRVIKLGKLRLVRRQHGGRIAIPYLSPSMTV